MSWPYGQRNACDKMPSRSQRCTATLAVQVRAHEMGDLIRQLRRLQRMAENLGLVSLGLVAADVRICLDSGDVTAFAAVWARLLRIAERSLSTDKELLDQTLI